jgi:hypothetical protein
MQANDSTRVELHEKLSQSAWKLIKLSLGKSSIPRANGRVIGLLTGPERDAIVSKARYRRWLWAVPEV